MPRRPNDGYDADASETLQDDGVYVEPDVRRSIKKYLKAMGLTSKKKIKVSELRQAIRSAIAEGLGQVPLKCPGCGSRDIGLWSISGEVKDPDWAECKKCGASGRIAQYELVEASNTMGRMNFMSTADEDEEETEAIEEFADWAQGFQDNFDNKRYETIARQVFNNWPHRGPDVDWAKVVDVYIKSRAKNIHSELDKNKLYEKVLSLAEDNYDGDIPPVAQVSQHQYGGSGSGSA
jgi:hypothetical protein